MPVGPTLEEGAIVIRHVAQVDFMYSANAARDVSSAKASPTGHGKRSVSGASSNSPLSLRVKETKLQTGHRWAR